MPPRTMNTATAKFTMRLHIVSLYITQETQTQGDFARLPSSTYKISEKSMAESLRCGNRSLTTGIEMGG